MSLEVGTLQPSPKANNTCSLGSLQTCALLVRYADTTATLSSATREDVTVFCFQVFLVPCAFHMRMMALCKSCVFSPMHSMFPCVNKSPALAQCTEFRISPKIHANLSHFGQFYNHQLHYSASPLPVFKDSLPQNFR